MIIRALLLLGILMFSITGATADNSPMPWGSGNELLNSCTPAIKMADGDAPSLTEVQISQGVACMSYLMGVAGAFIILREHQQIVCIADEDKKTPGQYARIVVKWLKDHPTVLDQDSPNLVAAALRDAYPCKQ